MLQRPDMKEDRGVIRLATIASVLLVALGLVGGPNDDLLGSGDEPRPEGLFWLREALYEDFESHPVLFELYPELASDVEITQLIEDNTL